MGLLAVSLESHAYGLWSHESRAYGYGLLAVSPQSHAYGYGLRFVTRLSASRLYYGMAADWVSEFRLQFMALSHYGFSMLGSRDLALREGGIVRNRVLF